jgi:hypothetical protein
MQKKQKQSVESKHDHKHKHPFQKRVILWTLLMVVWMSSCKTISKPQFLLKGTKNSYGISCSILGFQGDTLLFLKADDLWEVNLPRKQLRKVKSIEGLSLNTSLPPCFWAKQTLNDEVTRYHQGGQNVFLKTRDPFWRGGPFRHDLILKGNLRNETIRLKRSEFRYIYEVFVMSEREFMALYTTQEMDAYTWGIGWFQF